MKRFLKALPLIMIGGLTLTGCGSVDVDLKVHDEKSADLTVQVEAPKKALDSALKKQQKAQQQQQQQQQGGDSGKQPDVKVPEGITLGLLLDSNLQEPRTVLGEPSKVTTKETNHGKTSKVKTTLHDIDVDGLGKAGQARQMPISVSYDNDRYKFTMMPQGQLVKQADDVNFTVHLPRAVENASAGGEVEGHSVTWNLKDLKEGQSITATSENPGLPWWASLLIWVAGVAVTVLLIVIAFMPGGKPEPQQDEQPLPEDGPQPQN